MNRGETMDGTCVQKSRRHDGSRTSGRSGRSRSSSSRGNTDETAVVRHHYLYTAGQPLMTHEEQYTSRSSAEESRSQPSPSSSPSTSRPAVSGVYCGYYPDETLTMTDSNRTGRNRIVEESSHMEIVPNKASTTVDNDGVYVGSGVPFTRVVGGTSSNADVKPRRRLVQFNDRLNSTMTISTQDMEDRFIAYADLWYSRDELAVQRKGDCLRLIDYLKSLKQRRLMISDGVERSQAEDSSAVRAVDDDYCMRGLEIVVYKKQRDETKHRAAQTVFSEQDRQIQGCVSASTWPSEALKSSSSSTRTKAKRTGFGDGGSGDVGQSCPSAASSSLALLCASSLSKHLLNGGREKRSEGDSSSSSSSSSSMSSSDTSTSSSTSTSDDDQDGPDHGSENHLRSLERRIADRYGMATIRCRDEAYLRGLQDAQVARKIFLGSQP